MYAYSTSQLWFRVHPMIFLTTLVYKLLEILLIRQRVVSLGHDLNFSKQKQTIRPWTFWKVKWSSVWNPTILPTHLKKRATYKTRHITSVSSQSLEIDSTLVIFQLGILVVTWLKLNEIIISNFKIDYGFHIIQKLWPISN